MKTSLYIFAAIELKMFKAVYSTTVSCSNQNVTLDQLGDKKGDRESASDHCHWSLISHIVSD
jgi:hypothetical protein